MKIVKGSKPLTVFAKRSVLDVWDGSENTSGLKKEQRFAKKVQTCYFSDLCSSEQSPNKGKFRTEKLPTLPLEWWRRNRQKQENIWK